MSAKSNALISNIQRFCTHDGSGIRTTVFFKGCPLNCKWCHNPETQKFTNELMFERRLCIHCGMCSEICTKAAHLFENDKHVFVNENCNMCLNCIDICPTKAISAIADSMTAQEVVNEVLKDKVFYGDVGGLTLSGGEPLAQAKEAINILKLAKLEGINTAIETCGFFEPKLIKELLPLVDLFIWDYKDTSLERHKAYTGVTNEKILDNLRYLDSFDVKIWLRCIVVKGVNMDDENISGIIKTYHSLEHCEGVELMPYHIYGAAKGRNLQHSEEGNESWIPTAEDIASVKETLIQNSVKLLS